jgi:hypothetical protein
MSGLNYGINFKVIRRIVGDFASAWGFGLDVALKYNTGKWQFAAVGKDITSTFNAWSFNDSEYEDIFEETGNVMPEGSLELTLPRLILGTAYGFNINERFSAVAEIDVDTYFDGKRNDIISTDIATFAPHSGLELKYRDLVFLRGGVQSIQKVKDFDEDKTSVKPTFGVGLVLWRMYIDYALTGIGEVSLTPYSHIISLRYAFSPKN